VTMDIGTDEVLAAADADVLAWRRDLHRFPELSFQEERTSQFVFDRLQTFPGLTVTRPTRTSVMAVLTGELAGPVVAVRADMDALPIQEETDLEFASETPGVMHACGHDGHTAILLGLAKVLSERRESVPGEVRFLFQHAEELLPGGATEMVAAGVMTGVEAVIGLHLRSFVDTGSIAIQEGAIMAATDTFHIVVEGLGGHAARPHLAVDTVAVAAQIVTNLQHLVARNTDPQEALVVSVTQFGAGTAHNVIPGSAELVGTVRSFSPKVRRAVPVQMERIVKGIAEAHGATYRIVYENGYSAVVNDDRVTQIVRSALVEVFGARAVVGMVPGMGGEDFSALQAEAPGCFFFIGAGSAELGIAHPHHHGHFVVDEGALPIGLRALLGGTLALLAALGSK